MNRLFLPVGALVLALLIGVGAVVARAKEPHGSPVDAVTNGTIGSVDMEEIYIASGGPEELEQAGRQHEAEAAQRINKIMAVPYLEANELEEYGTLIGKAKMTPEEEKRATDLKTTNDQRSTELKDLSTKNDANLTAEDKSRIAHLNQLRNTLQTQVRPGLINDFRAQHEGWLSDYRHHQMVQLRQEVAKVAKDKGIAHVFEASTLVYSVNDLTPAVRQRVEKRANRRTGN